MTNNTNTDWWFRFFNHQDYLDLFHDMTGPDRTQKELRFCDQVLEWKPGELVLDAPCGEGRHTFALAARGFAMTGLDVSSYLIQRACSCLKHTRQYDYPPRFIRGLMQHIPLKHHQFHHVICMFSSFGYGESELENLQIMKEFYRVLQPGGKIMIDVMNRHFIVPRLNQVFHSEHKGLKVKEERSITENGKRLNNQFTITNENNEIRTYLYRPWLFNGWEISWLANQAGFKNVKVYGNFAGEAYHKNSERAMLAAQKPA